MENKVKNSISQSFLRVREVADLLGIHVETARRNMKLGKIPARKIAGNYYVLKDFFFKGEEQNENSLPASANRNCSHRGNNTLREKGM